jgi:UDP-glucose 4-epimerase
VWDLNKDGTFGVLEFWRNKKCKLVYAGSSTKFGDGGLGRVQSPYAWSKASNTELVQNYAAWYALPYAIAYFYNVYGPGEREGKYGTVIEIFKQKHARGEPLTVTAPGTQKRNFTHVNDIVDGLLLVGERGEGDEFGLGAVEAYSILDVANMFGGPIEMRPEAPGNRMDSTLDTTKARALGWVPRRTLVEYIESIV